MAELIRNSRITCTAVMLLTALFSTFASAQVTKELRFKVGPKPLISITNDRGSITVQAVEGNQVIATMLARSETVKLSSEQRSNRMELRVESNLRSGEFTDCTVSVPTESVVSVNSSDGRIHVLGLSGDVIVEATGAAVDVTDIRDAHVHIKTLTGSVALRDIHRSHLEINSISGDVRIQDVAESTLDVHSGSGMILYDGNPGESGNYSLTSHTGNLEVSIPATASVDIRSRSLLGEADQDVAKRDAGPAANQENRFLSLRKTTASRFVLRSFKGRIRIRRP